MDERSLRLLEFPKVREQLVALAVTALGHERAQACVPSGDLDVVRKGQQETDEAVQVLAIGPVPLRAAADLRPTIHRSQIGSMLSPADFLTIRTTLMTVRDCRACLLSRREQAPTLADLAGQMETFESLEAAIRRTVADDGTILDSASDTLARCRRDERTIQGRLRERLEELVKGPLARMLQDPIITMRGERYVVPVRQEFRSEFPGILHDQSSSGATVFMEPLALVPLGNQLRALEAAERDEVAKLLRDLTAKVAAEAEPIARALDALGMVDFAIAKALLAQQMNAVSPGVRSDGILRLLGARHPLLHGEVVPIDISLGEEFTTLVVTGPNTGGKTVTLKTVGLLTLMAQAGLHLPTADGSEISVFPQVLADIGDEQSIEQSLSTFSSHMGAIVGILAQLRGPALVLLDEIGAGTDPTEGVALARALIEHLHAQGVRTIVTTHYNELKALAYLHPGIQNASVEFNIQTLRPTYRVLIGLPGRSNALTIASRLGLDEAIVEQAKTFLNPGEVAIDRILSDIETDRRAYEWELSEAAVQRQKADEARARYEDALKEIREGRRRILGQAREEAKALLERTRREIAAILESVKAAARPVAAQEAQQRLREVAAPWAEPPLEVPVGERLTEVHPGQQVFIVPLNVTGTVRTAPDARGEVDVESGVLRVRVSVGALRSVLAEDIKPPIPPAGSGIGAPADVAESIDVRGQTVDEAIPAVDHYLDEAVRAGLPRVTIIHGKGLGILRQAIGEFLRRHPHVQSFRLGGRGEGETGVTVVELKA